MPQALDKLTIKGFKSIQSLEDFELKNLNILIGANGAGKSNFVSFFSFMREAVEGRLNLHFGTKGGAYNQLFPGPKITKHIYAYLQFGHYGYELKLEPTVRDNSLIYADESIHFSGKPNGQPIHCSIGTGHYESKIKKQLKATENWRVSKPTSDSISKWFVYHLNDTSDNAAIRRPPHCARQ